MRPLEDINNEFLLITLTYRSRPSDALADFSSHTSMLHTSCVAGRLGRDDKASSTALSTALETAEAIDLESWSGCVAIFAIIPALVTHVPSHMDVLRLLITY